GCWPRRRAGTASSRGPRRARASPTATGGTPGRNSGDASGPARRCCRPARLPSRARSAWPARRDCGTWPGCTRSAGSARGSARPGAGELQEGGRAEALGVAREESEAIAQVDVDSGSRVEAREAEHASTRATQAIVDVVPQIVPASRRGQDHARALAEEALQER